MDNYEINILRRNGNWKKVKPQDLLLESVVDNEEQQNSPITENKVDFSNNNQEDFLNYLNQVNLIIDKLESLENEKTNLKKQLKIFEDQFLIKKKETDEKIKLISKESEMLDKTISIIKNLKSF